MTWLVINLDGTRSINEHPWFLKFSQIDHLGRILLKTSRPQALNYFQILSSSSLLYAIQNCFFGLVWNPILLFVNLLIQSDHSGNNQLYKSTRKIFPLLSLFNLEEQQLISGQCIFSHPTVFYVVSIDKEFIQWSTIFSGPQISTLAPPPPPSPRRRSWPPRRSPPSPPPPPSHRPTRAASRAGRLWTVWGRLVRVEHRRSALWATWAVVQIDFLHGPILRRHVTRVLSHLTHNLMWIY